MRIAVLSNTELVNSNYRAHHPLRAVAQAGGHTLLRNETDKPVTPEALLACDVVHVHRIATPQMRTLARRLREARVGIVWDNDDDVMALPRSNPLHRRFGASGRRELTAGTTEMIRLAHVVTTPSHVLAARYRELGATDVRVIENHLPAALLNASRPRHDGVVIACTASLEHAIDYEQLGLHDTLARLLDAHRDLRVLSLGLRLPLPPERYENLKRTPFLELVATLACADIGIAPLVDIPWNRARSNVKLKEYAAAGLAWLASPVGPYRDMDEQQGGRLVPDDGWHDALERLVASGRERRKLAKRGARWVKGESVDRHAREWGDALQAAALAARSLTRRAS